MKLSRKHALYAAVVAGMIALPQFITVKYYLHLSILALVWVIAAQGQNLIQGYTGYVSIVCAGFMGIGAYSTALLGQNYDLPTWLTIALAPLITAVFAIATGYPSLRVKGHYFAIVTLAFNMVIFIVLFNWTALTNGEAGITGIPKPGYGKKGLINFHDREVYYYFVLTLAVLMTGLAALIVRSRVGQILMAIRQNEDLVGSIGVAAWKFKLFAFVVSAMFAGLAGCRLCSLSKLYQSGDLWRCPIPGCDPGGDHGWLRYHCGPCNRRVHCGLYARGAPVRRQFPADPLWLDPGSGGDFHAARHCRPCQ